MTRTLSWGSLKTRGSRLRQRVLEFLDGHAGRTLSAPAYGKLNWPVFDTMKPGAGETLDGSATVVAGIALNSDLGMVVHHDADDVARADSVGLWLADQRLDLWREASRPRRALRPDQLWRDRGQGARRRRIDRRPAKSPTARPLARRRCSANGSPARAARTPAATAPVPQRTRRHVIKNVSNPTPRCDQNEYFCKQLRMYRTPR